jgi:hypothetical protein
MLRCALDSTRLLLYGNQSCLLHINTSSFSNGCLQLQHDGRQPNASIGKACSKQSFVVACLGSCSPAQSPTSRVPGWNQQTSY